MHAYETAPGAGACYSFLHPPPPAYSRKWRLRTGFSSSTWTVVADATTTCTAVACAARCASPPPPILLLYPVSAGAVWSRHSQWDAVNLHSRCHLEWAAEHGAHPLSQLIQSTAASSIYWAWSGRARPHTLPPSASLRAQPSHLHQPHPPRPGTWARHLPSGTRRICPRQCVSAHGRRAAAHPLEHRPTGKPPPRRVLGQDERGEARRVRCSHGRSAVTA